MFLLVFKFEMFLLLPICCSSTSIFFFERQTRIAHVDIFPQSNCFKQSYSL